MKPMRLREPRLLILVWLACTFSPSAGLAQDDAAARARVQAEVQRAVQDYFAHGADATSIPKPGQPGAEWFHDGANITRVPRPGEPGAEYFSRGADLTSIPSGGQPGADYFSRGADATRVPSALFPSAPQNMTPAAAPEEPEQTEQEQEQVPERVPATSAAPPPRSTPAAGPLVLRPSAVAATRNRAGGTSSRSIAPRAETDAQRPSAFSELAHVAKVLALAGACLLIAIGGLVVTAALLIGRKLAAGTVVRPVSVHRH
jgi:hypothetical protein